jgi:hypothetical protein
MYYLNYYEGIYLKQHIPIHYVLVVGYDDEKKEVYVQDCTFSGVQNISYEEFEKALNVNVPAMNKKNTIRVFNVQDKPKTELEITKKGLKYRDERMLKPPVSILGIPAMRKLAKEVFNWENKSTFKNIKN